MVRRCSSMILILFIAHSFCGHAVFAVSKAPPLKHIDELSIRPGNRLAAYFRTEKNTWEAGLILDDRLRTEDFHQTRDRLISRIRSNGEFSPTFWVSGPTYPNEWRVFSAVPGIFLSGDIVGSVRPRMKVIGSENGIPLEGCVRFAFENAVLLFEWKKMNNKDLLNSYFTVELVSRLHRFSTDPVFCNPAEPLGFQPGIPLGVEK